MTRKEYIRSANDQELAKIFAEFDLDDIADYDYCMRQCSHRCVPRDDGTIGCDIVDTKEGCIRTDEDVVMDWLNEEMEEE